jgi:prevent-host-death family protein
VTIYGAGAFACLFVTYSILPRAFPEKFQWPGAMSSLTVARQRGIYTRFPILLKARRTREPLLKQDECNCCEERSQSDRSGNKVSKRENLEFIVEMTIMTNMTNNSRRHWTVAEAKAKFSEVIDHAKSQGPQTITRNGRTTAVIVAADEWERKTKRKGNLAEFFASSPLRGSGLKIKRVNGKMRRVDL